MPYLRYLFISLAITCIGDFLALKFYPQSGSRVLWTATHITKTLNSFRNVTHKFADLFCNRPEECKEIADAFFDNMGKIPNETLTKLVDIMNKISYEQAEGESTVVTNADATIREAVDYGQTELDLVEKGTMEDQRDDKSKNKALSILKALRFSSYDENNLCDIKQGISPDQFDMTVEEVADLTNMPTKLKRTIKRAKTFTGGNVLAVNKLQFKDEGGNLVFGRVAVIRRRQVLDMAYSLHSVEYQLKTKQTNPDHARTFEGFVESLDDRSSDDFDGVTVDLREDFLTFFHKQAIDGFTKHCGFVSNAMKSDNRRSDVLQALGVQTDNTSSTPGN